MQTDIKKKDATTCAYVQKLIDTYVEIEPLFEEQVDCESFSKSDFRVVKVKECIAVKKSKKLLQFTLDDGTGTDRTILSGIQEDWIIVENCHEPLVSVEDFKLAHKMIARREKSPRKPNGKWRKSYLRCGVCGKGLNKYGNGSSYRCREGHVSRIRGEEIKQAVLDVARKMALVRLEEFEIQINKDSSSNDIGQEIESLKKAKAHYAKLKFEIYDDYTRTNITREQMAKKAAEVKNKIAELDRMIAEKQERLIFRRICLLMQNRSN